MRETRQSGDFQRTTTNGSLAAHPSESAPLIVQSKIRNQKSKIASAFLLALFVTNVAAQTTATIHRSDGRIEKIRLADVQFEPPDKGLIRGLVSDRVVEYRPDELWQIEFGAERVARGSAEQLWLNDGTRLAGQLVQWIPSQRALTWTDLFRTVNLSEDAIVGLTRGYPPPSRLPVGVAGKDALYTSDGDRLMGRLLRIENDDFAFRSELGNITCARQKVAAFTITPKSESRNPQSESAWVLEFANGDRVWTRSWGIDAGRLRCAVGGGTPTAPSALLRRAIHLGPRVQVFSKTQPQHFTMNPLLAGTRAILVDRGPENRPLRIGEHEYLFGLFLRPECEMEYALADDSEFFLADLGLASDVAREAGSARAMFALGDAPWKTYDLAQVSQPVSIALGLSGSKQLRIRIEAADDWGCGAHVVLGEPVLIKKQK